MQADTLPVLWHLVSKAVIGLVITGIGALMLYPLNKIKQEWKGLRDAIASAEAELVQQRVNCLATLQTQGEKQIEILTKVSETLSDIHLDQARLLGRLEK